MLVLAVLGALFAVIGRTFEGKTLVYGALAFGLVNRITPAGTNVVDDTLSFIEPIVSGAPIAQRAALEAIDAASALPLEAGLDRERELYELTLGTSDRREALEAFAAKRKPVFTGK